MKKRHLLICCIVVMVLCACGGGKPTRQDQVKLALISPAMAYCNSNGLTLDGANAIDVAQMKETGNKENEYTVSGKFYAKDKYGDKVDYKYEAIARFNDGWENDYSKIDIPWDEFYIVY